MDDPSKATGPSLSSLWHPILAACQRTQARQLLGQHGDPDGFAKFESAGNTILVNDT